MKKQISFFISLVLIIAAGFYLTPDYTQAGEDEPCYISGIIGPGHGTCTVTIKHKGVIVSSCNTISFGWFVCGPLDPDLSYSVHVDCPLGEGGCSTGASNVTCKEYVDLTNAPWDCY